MQKTLKKIKKTFKYYTGRRFSTIAGTLVYFFLMSIAPFILWLTLLLGNVNFEQILPGSLFDSISPFISYLKSSAQSAASSAGIILLITSLYSSTNFFYHLRRSGEIVYGSPRVKGGVKLRIISAILIVITVLALWLLVPVTIAARYILLTFMPEVLCDIISMIFLTVLAFAVAILLNIFACPYKIKPSQALTGSLLTTVLWVIFVFGFAVYVQFGSPGKLYGAIASVIVFLLWCYFMMCCFVIGMIKNGADITQKHYKTFL